jgi:formylglycine-generating enzyme required for sulfatase activity
VIDLPTSLPANLHLQGDGGGGAWYLVGLDSRVELPAATRRIVLTTIDGRPYELRSELPDNPPRQNTGVLPPLTLSHLAEDSEEARAIADWLGQQGIAVQLVTEPTDEAKPGTAAEAAEDSRRLLRLWTPAARRRWAERALDEALSGPRTLLLRVGETSAPPAGYGAEKLLDLPDDWRQGKQSALAARVFEQLHDWLATDQVSAATPATEAGEDAADEGSEAARLLAELDDPETTPPRRLETGNRPAEIGDTRPGVGVVLPEVVPEDSGGQATPSEAEQMLAELGQHVLPEVVPEDSGAQARPSNAYQLYAELEQLQTPPLRRLAIGDRLAEIGDPRYGVGLDARGLPEIHWVEIPEGKYIYQEGWEGETRRLKVFLMARYPITNAQYQAFIDAGGYGRETPGLWQKVKYLWPTGDWWRKLKRPAPQASRWPQSNRPKTNVDWYEAVAFCRWLSAQLDREVRLPTEDEWERAARGPEKSEYDAPGAWRKQAVREREEGGYPWGKKYKSGYANINETLTRQPVGKWNLGQTTAVGVYPQGASSEGVFDLAGNVWEWCLNKYHHPEQIEADSSGDWRVLRGGSWDGDVRDAGSSRRGWDKPDYRDGSYGFRVVSSAPISRAAVP